MDGSANIMDAKLPCMRMVSDLPGSPVSVTAFSNKFCSAWLCNLLRGSGYSMLTFISDFIKPPTTLSCYPSLDGTLVHGSCPTPLPTPPPASGFPSLMYTRRLMEALLALHYQCPLRERNAKTPNNVNLDLSDDSANKLLAFPHNISTNILNYKQVNLDGLTGPVQFSEYGTRRKINLDVLNLRNNSFFKVGSIVTLKLNSFFPQ